MRRLLPLLALLLASLACSLPGAEIQPQAQPLAPAQTSLPTPTLTPQPTATQTPLPIVTDAAPAPAFLSLRMFTSQNGWAVVPGNIVRTSDGGKTWQPLLLPLVDLTQTTFSAYFFDENRLVVLSSRAEGSGLFSVSADGGKTWQQMDVLFDSGFLTGVENEIYALQTLGAGMSSQPVAVQHFYNDLTTVFQPFTHTPGEPEPEGSLPVSGNKTGLAFIAPTRGWVTGGRPMEDDLYFFRTDDSGVTWQVQPLLPPEGLGRFMAMTYPPVFFAGDNLNGVLPVDFYPNDGEVSRVFYFTADGGETWLPTGPLFPQCAASDFINPQTGWVVSQGQLLQTVDSGQSWSRLPVAFNPRESVTLLDFANPTQGWLVTLDDSSTYRLYATQDGGYSWILLR